MKYRFHPQAVAELEESVRFYEDRRIGLGERFADAIEAAIAEILAAPSMWPMLEAPIRCHLARVFPYAVLYTIQDHHVLIVAVMHCHRDPGYWKSRLSNER